ncbi:hypothetical protein K437DRAFT_59062 [Tilletiaria anomala UBC 951]|uniref:Uncharacterized protein n=1 Tax=Tilletiaria anomala (strain ATCC 24038 / CBS 436.72 / UBC 951) TaxID=1037660 RepID=A0A066VBM9_TILAU|nr:uncharacterized protein K437DRAFT_59062 [Tilletiaria anomala UBC 951]KDN36169.1 hypothetical protein K437DRAFT_59062 [Tilletiaria anomala UBC 951]
MTQGCPITAIVDSSSAESVFRTTSVLNSASKYMRMLLSADHQSSTGATVEVFSRRGKCSKHRTGSASINQHHCLTWATHLIVRHPSRIT